MDIEKVKGIIIPIVTPVNRENQIKIVPLERVVGHVIQGGVNGILAFGNNGGFFVIDKEERKEDLQTVVKSASKRVSVCMGIGSITAKEEALMARTAEGNGVDGLSILSPMFTSPTDDELYQHIITIAEAAPHLSVSLYSNPGKVGYSLNVSSVVCLSQHPNIAETENSSGNVHSTAEHIRRIENEEFKVMAGRNTLILGSLVYGATGAVASIANVVPELVVSIYEHYYIGNLSSARNAQLELTKFRNMFGRASLPIVTKDVCNLIGLGVGASALPNTTSPDQLKKEVSEILEKIINK